MGGGIRTKVRYILLTAGETLLMRWYLALLDDPDVERCVQSCQH
jgi:hypothetical protein